MLDLEDDGAGIQREHRMPAGDRGLQHRGLFPQHGAGNDGAFVIEIEHHEAPLQRGEQLPGLQVAMGADIGTRLHGDGQALDGVGQLLMQVVVHAQARGVGGLVGEAGKAGNIQFFHM